MLLQYFTDFLLQKEVNTLLCLNIIFLKFILKNTYDNAYVIAWIKFSIDLEHFVKFEIFIIIFFGII